MSQTESNVPRRGWTPTRTRQIVAAVFVACVVAACSGGGSGSGAAEVSTLRVDMPSQPSSLDPIAVNDPEGQRITRLVYEALYDWDEDSLEIVPQLASALPEVSDDGLTYTVALRDDATWHDGEPFTADDVVFTYETNADAESGSRWNAALASLDEVTKVDDTTVEFTLSKRFTYFPDKLAMIPIISESGGYEPQGNLDREMMGTGPFSFVSWADGQQVSLERNEEYYGPKPGIEGVEFHIVSENATRVANLVNGTTHIVPALPASLMENVERSANVEVLPENGTRVYLYPNLQEGKPTADVNVRLAIANAVDRKAIIDQVYGGAARSSSTYLTFGSRYHNEELGLTYGDGGDIEEAKSLMADAENPPTETLRFAVKNLPELIDTATIIQSDLAEIGIDVEIQPLEIGTLTARLLDQDYDLLMLNASANATSGFAPDYPANGLRSGSTVNFNEFSNPEMDELLDAALAAEPGDPAQEAWDAVQELDVQTQGQIQLLSVAYIEAFAEGLGDYEPSTLTWLNNVPDIGVE